MGVDIRQPKKNQGSMGDSMLKMVMSYFTGGASTVADKQRDQNQAKPAPTLQAPQAPAASAPPADAMGRRMQAYQADPQATLNAGLEALKDPSVPDELRQQYAQPLLQAKHYGRWS